MQDIQASFKPKKGFEVSVKIKDVECAKKALLNHKVITRALTLHSNSPSTFIEGSGVDGELNAVYKVSAINDEVYYTIRKRDDYFTTYFVSRRDGSYEYEIVISIDENNRSIFVDALGGESRIKLWLYPVMLVASSCLLLPVLPCLCCLFKGIEYSYLNQVGRDIQLHVMNTDVE